MNGRTIFQVPGTSGALVYERDAEGRIVRITADDRCYLDATVPDRTSFDDGFVAMRSVEAPNALLRSVRVDGERWTETYRWNDERQMIEIDDVLVTRDAGHRVLSCRGPAGAWFYGYSGDHLTVVDGPFGLRQIVRDSAGRPRHVRESQDGCSREYGIEYDDEGRRLPRSSQPGRWHFDELGRRWAVTGADGRVIETYLWSDFQCFGRIDGAPGGPLAAVFSLDMTGTPVRVIDRHGVRRVWRDAFGESLLHESGVPGLYGGAVDGLLVRLPYRRLDPRTGSFDRPDPFTGHQDDPRRAKGYEGALLAERPAAGPYVVARNDPVSLADPTGAISDLWWLIPSSLTWSYQNTMASIFGFWLTIDFTPGIIWFILNLLTLFQVDDLRNSRFGGAFDVELLSAKNFGAFALRAGGLLDMLQPTAWTYQFIVNESGENLTKLQFARLFQPDAAFTPLLYGTVLHCVPSSGKPFLLRGQRTSPNSAVLTSWSRNGGKAQSAFPGSFEPVFPEGALHFASVQTDRVCPQSATISELTPQTPVLGTATTNRAQGTWPGDNRGAAKDQLVALIGTAVEIVKITDIAQDGGNTVASFDTPAASVQGQTVRLRGLPDPPAKENLRAQGARSLSTVVAGSALAYAVDDVLRFTLGGAVVQRATVLRFEAILNVDLELPNTFASDIHVFRATQSGTLSGTVINATQFTANHNDLLNLSGGIVVRAIPAVVKAVNLTTNTVTTDRAILPVGGMNWRKLTRGANEIGIRAGAAEPTPTVTFAPVAIRTAPASGFLWCESGGDIAIRVVTARVFDGIVVSADLPDPAALYSVELFKPLATPDINDAVISTTIVAVLSQPVASKTRALQVMEFAGAGIGAGATLLTATVKSGQNLTGSIAANAVPGIVVSDAVVLSAGGTLEAAVVSQLRAVVRFMTNVPGRDTNLEAARLQEGPPYAGEIANPANLRTVRVLPRLNGDPVDLPRFLVNDLVRVSWGAAAPINPALERFYRITKVDGSTIEGEGDNPIDPAAGPLLVHKLTADDPGTGTARLGRDGHRAGTPPSPNQIEFAVWSASAFSHEQIVAIIGDAPVPRRVDFKPAAPIGARDLTLVLVSATTLNAPVTVARPNLTGAPLSRFTTEFKIDAANHVEFTDPKVFVAGGTSFLAVPYVEPASLIKGTLKAGSVRVPDDHETDRIENTRREAVVDHELTHTLQSARLGPWLFTWFPNWLGELIGESTSASVDHPDYSKTVEGQYREEQAVIEIAAFGEISLDKDQTVQVSQDGRTARIKVRNHTDAVFSLNRDDLGTLSSAGVQAGTVGIRKQLVGTGGHVYEYFMKGSELLTLGGLMNLFSAASYGGIFWLILRICQAMKAKSEVTFDAQVTNPTVITADEGVTIAPLDTDMTIAIRQGDKVYLRKILDIQIQAITIDRPIPLTGAVALAIYEETGAVHGDSNKYVPGTAADRNRPAIIRVPSLTLEVNDRIIIRNSSGQSRNTKVTAKNEDGTVEVEEPVLIGSASSELLIAKLRPDDPFGWLDQMLLDKMHIGFLQYLHDPYGQINYRVRPTSTIGKIFARSARYLFGTKMWGLPFLTGYFWYDNAYRRSNPETSGMEQEASFRSGDTYCPLASLHGTIDVVGDVARYWLTADGAQREGIADMIDTSKQDSPGVHAQRFHQVSVSTAANTGYSVPDLFAAKTNGGRDWDDVGSQGWIPMHPELERSSGSYVAFSRPPQAGAQHTIDARSVSGLSKSITAQSAGPSGVPASPIVPVPPSKRVVQVSFPRDVKDVAVTIAGAPVAEADVVKFIPFQTAGVTVDPGGERQYRMTVSQPGRAARVAADALTLQIANAAVGTRDFAEISRFYALDAANPDVVVGIGPMHLATPVHVAVRRFEIEIGNQLTAIGGVIGAPPVTDVHAGDQFFLLVPAPPFQTPPPALVSAVVITPQVAVDQAASDAVRVALGPVGVAYRINIDVRQPPEADVVVTFNWRVGTSAADSAPVTATFTLKPNFQLNAASFNVARGGDITLESSDGTQMGLEDGGAGVTLSPNQPPTPTQVTLRIDAATTPGPRTILMKDLDPTKLRFARRLITVT